MNTPHSSSLSSDKPELDGGHPSFGALVEKLDARLRHRHGVHSYSKGAGCIFRIEVAQARHELALSDGMRLHAGEHFINLHMWNDHVPAMSPEGPTFRWARQMDRVVSRSLRELVDYLTQQRDLDDAKCVCVNLGLGPPERTDQIVRVMRRYGFDAVIASNRMSFAERMQILGENILISMFVFARNPMALRADSLRRGRILMGASRETLERHYGLRSSQG